MTISIQDLTQGTVGGSGVFDKLMSASKEHLEMEFRKGAIKGPEYATVYLGQLQQVMQTAVAFLGLQHKLDLEADLLQAQIDLVRAQIAETQAQQALLVQQELNAEQENKNLIAQECLLKAQYDNMVQTTQKTAAEVALLNQKVITEKAQTQSLGVDQDSVIGKQKSLYQAQTDGFARDAEQKAAKIMVDTWNVRRTTDEGTVADTTNKLDDATVGRTITKMLTGIQA